MIQSDGYILRTHAVQLPGEDVPHDVCGIFVHNKAVFVRFVLHITIHGKSAYVLSALALDFKLCADFHGNVPAVCLVDKVLERNDQIIRSTLFAKTIIVVVDGDEANTKKGENLLDIFACVKIVTTKAREVFYDNAVCTAFLYILHHLFEIRSFKV